MRQITPEVVVNLPCALGEGPLWHPDEKRIYWTDIHGSRIHRHDPASGLTESFNIGSKVGGMTLQADGALLLFMSLGAVAVWRGERPDRLAAGTANGLEPILDGLPGEEDNRFNDVIADPEGRVFCGTLSTPKHAGRLYRLDTDRRVTVLIEGVGTSNGLGFTPDLRGLYYIDTPTQEVRLFDYDRVTGNISRPRTFAQIAPADGKPDGLTVDAEGCVWVALWDGACVVRFSPDGRELLRIPFPTRLTSCPAFGGKDLTDIYVTSAGGDKRSERNPLAGALFRINCGVRGVPEFRSRI